MAAVDAPSTAAQPGQELASGAGLVVGNAGASGVRGGGTGTLEPAARHHGYPRSLLWRVEEPPATTRASNPLLQLTVVPRTPSIQVAEDVLSLALLALMLGTRPLVTLAMMLQHLHDHYGITEDRVTVRTMRPDDFIIQFSS